MSSRATLHALVEELPDSDIAHAERVLAALRDTAEPTGPQYTLETAPFDDEPETAEEQAAVAEALEDLREGRTIAHEDVKRRWGLV